jgi:hypothetical protein
MATLEHVSPADSWVLEVTTTDSSVCFLLDAVLQEAHPRFYWPPKPGEQHAYARLRWCISGQVHWNTGPNLASPATDANGELDFGHIDVWLQLNDGNSYMLEGDWGCVVIGEASETVEYLE